MLEAEVVHDIKKNYLVIQGTEEKQYMIQMLDGNSVKGFLELDVRILDNKRQYYYDITGKETLVQKSSKAKWKKRDVIQAVSNILDAIGRAREYLLWPDHFVLKPEYVYRQIETGEVFLCYTWSYEKNINEQLTELFSYFLEQVDYADREAVELVYRLYDISREENCTLQRLWSGFSMDRKEIQQKPEESQRQYAQAFMVGKENKGCQCGENGRNESIGAKRKEEGPLSNKKNIRRDKDKAETGIQKIKKTKSMHKENKDDKEKKQVVKISVEKIVVAVVLQIAILLALSVGAKYGLFWQYGQLSYTKMGGCLLICGILDWYTLSKVFKEEEERDPVWHEEEQEIKQKQEMQEPKEIKKVSTANFYSYEKTDMIDSEKTIVQPAPLFGRKNEMQRPQCYLVPENEEQIKIEVAEFPFFIGRFQKDTDQLKEQVNISRMHCKLEKQNGRFFLSDLHSTNGTYINQKRLEGEGKEEVKEGDVISLADIQYRFTLPAHI